MKQYTKPDLQLYSLMSDDILTTSGATDTTTDTTGAPDGGMKSSGSGSGNQIPLSNFNEI